MRKSSTATDVEDNDYVGRQDQGSSRSLEEQFSVQCTAQGSSTHSIFQEERKRMQPQTEEESSDHNNGNGLKMG